MNNIYFTIGPTQTFSGFDKCLNAAIKKGIPSISHRGTEFEGIFRHTVASLEKLLNIPEGFHFFFLGSATEAMERIIENCCLEHSYHFVNGAFSKRFFLTSQDLKKNPVKLEVKEGEGFNFSKVVIPEDTEVVCLTHNETATGVKIEMRDVYQLKKRNPEKIFAIDIVSSAPYVDVDFTMVDCVFFSVQKGFGLPAGLGVLIVNEKCIQKSLELQKKNVNIGSYHNFPTMLKSESKHNTPETPNVLGLYELGYISDIYNKRGVENLRKETEGKARMMYDFFDDHSELKPFVKNKNWRSNTVIVVETPQGSREVINKLAKKGIIVGPGYGEFKDKHIRIANFPIHKKSDVKRMLKILNDRV